MSGIAGFVEIDGCGEGLLEAVAGAMRYIDTDRTDTWSDGFASFVRVHHSLSNAEPQPVLNKNGSIAVLLTGELFGYEEEKRTLAKRGHPFNYERNDAEYALRLFEEYGEESFARLNGSFVLALYEAPSRTLRIITDRLASYHLFYHSAPCGGLAFCTKLHPLLSCDAVPKRLNNAAVFEFFTFQKLLGTKTYYEDIEILPPASVLTLRDGRCTVKAYWEMQYRAEERSLGHWADELADTLRGAVGRRLRGPERIGVLLSGGLDSRAILAAADRPMVSFTMGGPDDLEVTTARRLAEATGCEHILLEPGPDHFTNLVDRAVEIGNGMYSFHHGWLIGFFDRFREHCDVLLHGNPPELFFRGTSLPHNRPFTLFGKRFYLPVQTLLREEELTDAFLHWVKRSLYGERPERLFTAPLAARYRDTLDASICAILDEADGRAENVYDRFLWSDIHYTSRYSSYLLETVIRDYLGERTALLFDNELIELYLRIPLRYRAGNTLWKKSIARLDSALARIPDNNTGCPLTVPEFAVQTFTLMRKLPAIYRKHFGRSRARYDPFSQNAWSDHPEMIRRNKKFRRLIEKTLADPACIDPAIFDTARVGEMLRDHLAGRRNAMSLLFLLLTFGRWYKNYGPYADRDGGALK